MKQIHKWHEQSLLKVYRTIIFFLLVSTSSFPKLIANFRWLSSPFWLSFWSAICLWTQLKNVGITSNTKPICPPSFNCKVLGEFSFPFFNSTDWRCGSCKLNCKEKVPQLQLSEEGGRLYDVKRFVKPNTILIFDKVFHSLLHKRDCDSLRNLSLPSSPSINFLVIITITQSAMNTICTIDIQLIIFRIHKTFQMIVQLFSCRCHPKFLIKLAKIPQSCLAY